jgi:DNA-binding transcriptional ArsR family regulator
MKPPQEGWKSLEGTMQEKNPPPLHCVIFRKLGNPIVCDILEAIGNRRYTLPGLSRRVRQSKSYVCMYVSDLHKMGIVEKREIKGRVRYSLLVRRLNRVIRKVREIAQELEEGRVPAAAGPLLQGPASRQRVTP